LLPPPSFRNRALTETSFAVPMFNGWQLFVPGAYMFRRANLALPYLATAGVLTYLLVLLVS
jgi:hypothetical protein